MDNKTKVLALWGKSNDGKSKTILKFIDLLVLNGAEIENVEKSMRKAKDKWVVLRYKDKIIGITTRGDAREVLEKDFKNFANCDICVCATHLYGGTVKFIEENYCENNIYWLRKSAFSVGAINDEKCSDLETKYQYLNKRQAEDMLYLLDEQFKDGGIK